MDDLLVLLGLVVLAIPVAVIYLLVSQSGLRRRIVSLETGIARLVADQMGAGGAEVPQSRTRPDAAAVDIPPKSPEPGPKPAEPAAARVTAARKSAPAEAAKPADPGRATLILQWIAANWFYVVSALSLALAGLFLVQYGVENGLLPPAARVLAALVFGAGLIAGGEMIRRRFGDGVDSATAYLPSVFSGAGLVSLFGAVAAARLLYDLIGVEVAFVGMASVGLLGVVLGWRHGPLLTIVGVVGAFVAPMLVGSTVPATNWLYLYFAVVAAVGLAVDTMRRWAWVSGLSVGLGLFMGWLTLQGGGADLTVGFQIFVTGIAVLAILVPARGLWPDHDGLLMAQFLMQPSDGRPGFATALAGVAVALATAGLVWTSQVGIIPFWIAMTCLVLLAVALTLWSLSGPGLQDLALLPAVGAVIAVALEAAERGDVFAGFRDTYAQTPEADFPLAVTLLWAIGLGLSAVAAGRALRPGLALAWALGAAIVAPVMAIAIEVT